MTLVFYETFPCLRFAIKSSMTLCSNKVCTYTASKNTKKARNIASNTLCLYEMTDGDYYNMYIDVQSLEQTNWYIKYCTTSFK